MIKKNILLLLFGLLVGSSALAQSYAVLDTGDPVEGVCNPKSYTDLGNGIILDNVTGLEWDRWGSSGSYSWQGALDYCSSLNLGGNTDWRLPTVEELTKLMDAGSDEPAIAPVFFSYADLYWTTTIFIRNTGQAYFVDFGSGITNNDVKTKTFNVRAVRGGTGGQQAMFTVLTESELDVSVPSAGQLCSNDLDCDFGEECIADICVPSSGQLCSIDLDCDFGEECIADICVSSAGQLCSNDLDCDFGEECIADICVPSSGQPCSNDLDCDLGEECIDDICVPSSGQPCSNDLDCDSGEECIDDMCVLPPGQPGKFIVNGDGTVTDNNTDLVWTHCAYGQAWDGSQCIAEPQVLTWDEATAHIATLNISNYLGYDDWRLPTKNELESLQDRTCIMPTSTFPDMDSGFYWSSTNNTNGKVWAACYWFGNFHAEVPKTNNELYTMRAVRGGSCRQYSDWCMDEDDCAEGYLCIDGDCVEDVCELFVSHKVIRSEKLTKPRKVVLNITGEDDFDIYGSINLGPFESTKVGYNAKKGKLKVKAIVPAELKSGIIQISVGECFGEIEIQ